MNPAKMEREDGYYWVRHNGVLKIAEWAEAGWWLTGQEREVTEREVIEIAHIDRPHLTYDVEVLKEHGESLHYRIFDVATDSRIATCWDPRNAEIVVEALNHYAEDMAGEEGEDGGLEGSSEQLSQQKERQYATG